MPSLPAKKWGEASGPCSFTSTSAWAGVSQNCMGGGAGQREVRKGMSRSWRAERCIDLRGAACSTGEFARIWRVRGVRHAAGLASMKQSVAAHLLRFCIGGDHLGGRLLAQPLSDVAAGSQGR